MRFTLRTRFAITGVLGLAVLLGASALLAAQSPCGRSFIDVDNDGVCSPGDVSIDTVLQPLGRTGSVPPFVTVDVTEPVVADDGTVVYPGAVDNNPVGVVLGGSITINNGGGLTVFTTGTLTITGHVYGNNEVFEQFRSCRGITLARGASIQDQGAENEADIELTARADLCPLDTTAPSRLDLGNGARLITPNFMYISVDELRFGDHAQLRTMSSTLGPTGDVSIQAGTIEFGKSVKIFGTGSVEVSDCSGHVNAAHLRVQMPFLYWQQAGYPCDETLSSGMPYNVTSAEGQRFTFTSSSFLVSDGGFVQPYRNQDGAWPCDAVTLVKTRVGQGLFGFFPTPRIDPTGPCTGTIP